MIASEAQRQEVREAVDEVIAPRREDYRKHLALPVDNPLPVERAELLYVFDSYGNQYIDLSSGGVINPMGHCNPAMKTAVAEHLLHYGPTGSRGHLLRFQSEYARKLCNTFTYTDAPPPRVVFAESERDAVLSALSYARWDSCRDGTLVVGEYSWVRRMTPKGPWWGTLQAREHFTPDYLEEVGVLLVDMSVIVTREDCAWLQGLVQAVRDQNADAVVVVDESRSGFGRTGVLWVHQPAGIRPDMMVLGGPVGGGFGLGVVLVANYNEDQFGFPAASVLAGNPVACSAGLATFSQIHPGVLEHVIDAGHAFDNALTELKVQFPSFIKSHGGIGLNRTLTFQPDASLYAERFRRDALSKGLLIDPPGISDTIVLTPPLIISENEARRAVDIMAAVLMDWDLPG